MALPFLAAAGIGSLAGGLLNMFGESEEEKRNRLKRQQIEAMLKQMERERQLAQEEKKQSDRDASSSMADRRTAVNQKLSQYGYDPVGSIASNESDIIKANISNKANISQLMKERENEIQSVIDQLNATMEDEPSLLTRGLSGGLKGFNLASNIYGALSGIPGDNKTTGVEGYGDTGYGGSLGKSLFDKGGVKITDAMDNVTNNDVTKNFLNGGEITADDIMKIKKYMAGLNLIPGFSIDLFMGK
jgi:hypothetical protein